MVEATDGPIVELPRCIVAAVADLELDDRAGFIGCQVANLEARMAGLSHRVNGRVEAVERVMRRLELTEASH